MTSRTEPKGESKEKSEIREGQSVELLKALHILTRDGTMNSDSRRKLKQVYHLVSFIEPILKELLKREQPVNIVDVGAGKSYLGFILYDLFLKDATNVKIWAIETRHDLVEKSEKLASQFKFDRMKFINEKISDSNSKSELPKKLDLVLALHACDTATDDAIDFGLSSRAEHIVLVPCCQAEMAEKLKALPSTHAIRELWAHPHHRREFGSHLTNVLRGLKLESSGYKVRVTELVGWEHSMKNELIVASELDNKSYVTEARKRWKSMSEQIPVNTRTSFTTKD
ncbi:MAG: SAM-dependent methyltransferase [Xanthomonadaceae bacterium]|nr:SAM-dependent methyltransferase [Xanthomonadaceae bacterium]